MPFPQSIRHIVPETIAFFLSIVALGASASSWAGSPCDLVSDAEASHLLGVSAVRKHPTRQSGEEGCLIRAVRDPHSTLMLGVSTIAKENAARLMQHTDEARGSEVPSMHGEPWYEISVPDSEHPELRRLMIHRDRTNLSIDVHSTHQPAMKHAFESVWFAIANRLPTDEI